jgi:hypothetical protein
MNNVTLLAAALAAVATPAAAQQAVTNLDSPVPAGTSFGSIPGENSAGSTTEISATTALDANGSLHIAGDRTRVQTGVQYGGARGFPTNLGITADQLLSLTGDYIVNNGGTGGIQSPAFRVSLNNDSGARTELIWESSYNGGFTVGTPDSVTAGDKFWRYIAGCGADFGSTCGASGTYEMHTLAEWGDSLDLAGFFVSAFGVGDGSGAGAGFDAYVDHLSLATSNADFGTRTYDFQVAAAVPEPATWGMMLLGFGAIGFSMRRKRDTNALRQAA